MTIFARYLCWMFLLRALLVLLGIVGVMLSVELLETADNVLRDVGGRLLFLGRYALLRTPDLVSQLLPITALLAAMFTLLELARHRELVAMWVSGLSSLRIIRALLPAALVLVAVQFSIDNWAVPKVMDDLRAWGVGRFDQSNLGDDTGSVWIRSGNDIVRLPAEATQAGRLEDFTIFRRYPDGVLIDRLDVTAAMRQDDDTWLLLGIKRQFVENSKDTYLTHLRWEGQFDLESIALIAEEPRELRIDEIIRLIENDAFGQRRPDRYKTWLHYRFVSAAAPFLMIALVAALSHHFRGRNNLAQLFLFSLAIGLAFFVLDKASVAMGEVGLLPYWVAAWAPSVILLCLIGSFILAPESSRPVSVPEKGSLPS